MRVLLINDFLFSGGAETVYRQTFDILNSLNSELVIERFYASEKYKKASNPLEYIFSRVYSKQLRERLDSFRPDIIHLHVFHHLLTPSILLAIRDYRSQNINKLRVVYTAHDYNLIYPNSSLLRYWKGQTIAVQKIHYGKTLFHRVDNRGLLYSLLKKLQWYLNYKVLSLRKEIDTILCPSDFMRNVLVSYLENSDVRILRNPVEQDKKLKRKVSVDSIVKFVFFGRLSVEKGLYELLEYLSCTTESYVLDIYGDGPEAAGIRNMINLKGLQDKVRLKGFLDNDELKERLGDYDAMVLPSIWYENAPMSILEAGIVGITIIGSNLGGIPELARITGNYVMFDHKTVRHFNDIIKQCRDRRLHPVGDFSEFSYSNYIKCLMSVYTAL